MQTIYYFGENIRWNLGFVNPNIAGAFIAMLIALLLPFTSTKPKKKFCVFLILIVLEIALWFVLSKTYSRGALISAITCVAVVSVWYLYLKEKGVFSVLILKVIALSIIVCTTGFFDRISPEYIKSDGSVNARSTLWKGGVKMVSVAPISGWGVDNSGTEYINWYQDLDDDRKYAGMVNSYLHISVERGLPKLCIALTILSFLITLGFRKKTSIKQKIALASTLAIISYLCSNLFSTLWIVEPLQYLILAVFAISIVSNFILQRDDFSTILKKILASCAISLSACISIYVLGKCLSDENIELKKNAVIIKNDKAMKSVAIFPDKKILGTYYGKEIRKALQLAENKYKISTYKSFENSALEEKATVFLFGENAKYLKNLAPHKGKIIIVNPIGKPNSLEKNPIVYLPRLDIYNQNHNWLKALKTKQMSPRYLESSTQKITSNELKLIFKQEI